MNVCYYSLPSASGIHASNITYSHWRTLCNELYNKQYRSSHDTLRSPEEKWETKQRHFFLVVHTMQPVISHLGRYQHHQRRHFSTRWIMTSRNPCHRQFSSAAFCAKDSECHTILDLGEYLTTNSIGPSGVLD